MRHEVRTPERPEDKASEGTDGNSSNNSGPSDNEDAEYLAQGYTLLNTNLDSTSSDISDEDSAPEQVRRPSVTDTGVLETENSLDIEMAASHSVSSTPAPTLDSELYRILEIDKMYGRFPAQAAKKNNAERILHLPAHDSPVPSEKKKKKKKKKKEEEEEEDRTLES
ncbi:unnamed protein product [Dibothriocephalus latus]|uniref:Uncharacterized protein n=1 Tax=Dibothriocephalus latus TaxID=60516 RepID=A0A3P6TMM7_DIBLA|nr:unnamed protein product [Dibothriocephalus latus]